MREAYIGVDVGTGSARAGVFDEAGLLLASARRAIAIWRDPGAIVEQSSADAWRAVMEAVREAVEASGLRARRFRRRWLCRDLFAGGARLRLAAAVGEPVRRARTRHHGVDGSSRRRGRRAHHRRRPRGSALSRRRDVARDAAAEARLAGADGARDLREDRAFPWTDRLPHVSCDGLVHALALLGDLQVRLSGA